MRGFILQCLEAVKNTILVQYVYWNSDLRGGIVPWCSKRTRVLTCENLRQATRDAMGSSSVPKSAGVCCCLYSQSFGSMRVIDGKKKRIIAVVAGEYSESLL